MAKNDYSEIERLVRHDIRRGLAGHNVGPDGKPEGDRDPEPPFAPVRIEGTDARDGVVYANAITGERGTTAVERAFRCRHVGRFGGIFATDRELTIHGVPLVRTRGGKTQLRR